MYSISVLKKNLFHKFLKMLFLKRTIDAISLLLKQFHNIKRLLGRIIRCLTLNIERSSEEKETKKKKKKEKLWKKMWKNRRDKRKPVIEDFIEERTLHFYRIVDCRRWTNLQTYIRVLIVLQPRNRDMFLYFVQELFFRSRWYEYLRSFECDSNVDEKIGFLTFLIWESTRLGNVQEFVLVLLKKWL